MAEARPTKDTNWMLKIVERCNGPHHFNLGGIVGQYSEFGILHSPKHALVVSAKQFQNTNLNDHGRRGEETDSPPQQTQHSNLNDNGRNEQTGSPPQQSSSSHFVILGRSRQAECPSLTPGADSNIGQSTRTGWFGETKILHDAKSSVVVSAQRREGNVRIYINVFLGNHQQLNGNPQTNDYRWYVAVINLHPPNVVRERAVFDGAQQTGYGWYDTVVSIRSQHAFSELVVSAQRREENVRIDNNALLGTNQQQPNIAQQTGYGWYDTVVSIHSNHVFSELVVSGNNFDPANQHSILYGGTTLTFTRRLS